MFCNRSCCVLSTKERSAVYADRILQRLSVYNHVQILRVFAFRAVARDVARRAAATRRFVARECLVDRGDSRCRCLSQLVAAYRCLSLRPGARPVVIHCLHHTAAKATMLTLIPILARTREKVLVGAGRNVTSYLCRVLAV